MIGKPVSPGAELQTATSNLVLLGALYSVQGFKGKDIETIPNRDGTIQND